MYLADQKLPVVVPAVFGLSASSVSRRFVRASARRLQELQERSLADERWVAVVIDGKAFADDQLVIALGVTVQGAKRVLGLVQTTTENGRVCATFLRGLVERGFRGDDGLLVVLDGAKGLRAAVAAFFIPLSFGVSSGMINPEGNGS